MSSIDRVSVEKRMRDQGLEPAAWSNLPEERFEAHTHDYDKIVVVVEGSITFGMPGYGVGFMLGPGERLDLPAHVRHDAVVGPKGVSCLEAHLPAGTIGTRAKGRGYRW
ncbi:MAG: cupin [Candidatus Limnocylindrales bacterium]|jgi:quercetin dioxygenase-like cupin family protein